MPPPSIPCMSVYGGGGGTDRETWGDMGGLNHKTWGARGALNFFKKNVILSYQACESVGNLFANTHTRTHTHTHTGTHTQTQTQTHKQTCLHTHHKQIQIN